jgi:hypothetical protein
MRKNLFEAARHMPQLAHRRPGEAFDTHKSLALDWLVNQPGVRQAVFDLAKESGAIEYDPETRTWVGTGSRS